MKYFIDTEYDWTPSDGRIVPISIGIVAEDGRVFYAVTTMFALDRCNRFVIGHVLPRLIADVGQPTIHADCDAIARGLRAFIGDDTPEFWGDYAAFDYVVLSMIMGDFAQWPQSWPMHVNDLQQAGIASGEAEIPHNALSDARAVRDAWKIVMETAQ